MENNKYHFDILDDEHDTVDSTTDALNDYYTFGHLDLYLNEQYCQDEEMDVDETKILSQKLSQLSTKSDEEECNKKKRRLSSLSSSPDAIPKRIKSNESNDDDEINYTSHELDDDLAKIPFNLVATNPSFIYLTQRVLNEAASSMTMEDIQQLALVIYRLSLIRIHKQITMIYLKSGTGILNDPGPELVPVDRCVWPAVVQSALPPTNNTQDTQTACEQLVYDRLQRLDRKLTYYEEEFNYQKSCIIGFTEAMENMIDEYVQQMVIAPFKLKRDVKIATVRFQFDVEIMERKFQQRHPTEYQVDIAKRIYQARENMIKHEHQIIELKQRMIYNRPIHLSAPLHLQFDLYTNHLLKLEKEYYENQKLYNKELQIMWSNHRNLVRDKDMPTELSDLIGTRSCSINQLWQERFEFRFKYYLLYPYGEWESQQQQQQMSFQPYLYSDVPTVKDLFNEEQLKLLGRGPTYVTPYQTHLLSSTSQDDIVRKLYAPLKHQLISLFAKHKMQVFAQYTIETEFSNQFKECFLKSLPINLQQRAMYENQVLQSIHQIVNDHNLILRRTADNLNTFYVGDRSEFEAKAEQYFEDATDRFELVHISTHENHRRDHFQQLRKVVDYINNSLKIMKRRKDIDEETYNRIHVKLDLVKVSYLYFLPDISSSMDVQLVPFITSTEYHMIYKISQFLNQLLRPFTLEHTKYEVFQDEIDFIQRFQMYKPTTNTALLCTIKILNYSSLDTHESMITTVGNFIQDTILTNRLERMSVSTIKNLLQLCLCHTGFAYKTKFYKFLKGGPTTLPLMDTLSNIYLYVWQRKIFREIRERNEFFGRYKDEFIFTWHKSREEFDQFIEQISTNNTHLHIQASIGTSVQYLNGMITMENGCIKSQMYRNPNKHIYALPFVVGHAKVQYSNWIRSALIRAVCYCSSVEDFNRERIRIEFSMYANGYSYEFVEKRIGHFYGYFHASSLMYDLNQASYDKWRHKWFQFSDSRRQSFLAILKRKDRQDLLRFFYLYEYGKRTDFNKQFQLLWLKHFHQHPVLGRNPMIILLFSKHLYSLNTLLALK